eukprot:scaffold258_cov354-Prasinococcus_capsulatus_cf.AAC.4
MALQQGGQLGLQEHAFPVEDVHARVRDLPVHAKRDAQLREGLKVVLEEAVLLGDVLHPAAAVRGGAGWIQLHRHHFAACRCFVELRQHKARSLKGNRPRYCPPASKTYDYATVWPDPNRSPRAYLVGACLIREIQRHHWLKAARVWNRIHNARAILHGGRCRRHWRHQIRHDKGSREARRCVRHDRAEDAFPVAKVDMKVVGFRDRKRIGGGRRRADARCSGTGALGEELAGAPSAAGRQGRAGRQASPSQGRGGDQAHRRGHSVFLVPRGRATPSLLWGAERAPPNDHVRRHALPQAPVHPPSPVAGEDDVEDR